MEGNRLLREVATLLRAHSRPDDFAARMGGDEFVLVLPEIPAEVLQSRIRAIEQAVADLGRASFASAHFGVSVGHATFPANGADAEALLAAGVTLGVLIIQLRLHPDGSGFRIGDGGRLRDSGLFTGILAAGVAALFSIINGRLVQRHPALVITTLEMTSACALCVVGALLFPPETGLIWWPTAQDWS